MAHHGAHIRFKLLSRLSGMKQQVHIQALLQTTSVQPQMHQAQTDMGCSIRAAGVH